MPVIITNNNNEKQVWLSGWTIKFGMFFTYGEYEGGYNKYLEYNKIVKSEVLADNRPYGGELIEIVEVEEGLKLEEQRKKAMRFFRKQLREPRELDLSPITTPIVEAIKFILKIFLLPIAAVKAVPCKKIAKVAKKVFSFIAKVIVAIVIAPVTAGQIYFGMIKGQFENGIIFGIFSTIFILAGTVVTAPALALVLFGSAFACNLDNLL